MKRRTLYLLLLIFSLMMPTANCFSFCNYDVTIGFPFDIKPGEPSCDNESGNGEVMVQQEYKLLNINKDIFEVKVSDDNDYDGYERESMTIAIKGAQADPELSSIIDNCKIGNNTYTGYYGMGTYPGSLKRVYVVQFKLPLEFKSYEKKLVTVKSYLNESSSNRLFGSFFIQQKEIQ